MESTVEIVLGRLVEIRIGVGFHTVFDVDVMFERLAKVVAAKLPPDTKRVTVADWRRCSLLSDAAAARMLERMTVTNPLIARAAALASRESASAVMQFFRLVRESGTSERRLFFHDDELIAWTGEVLTLTETARLRRFLNEPAAPPRTERV